MVLGKSLPRKCAEFGDWDREKKVNTASTHSVLSVLHFSMILSSVTGLGPLAFDLPSSATAVNTTADQINVRIHVTMAEYTYIAQMLLEWLPPLSELGKY